MESPQHSGHQLYPQKCFRRRQIPLPSPPNDTSVYTPENDAFITPPLKNNPVEIPKPLPSEAILAENLLRIKVPDSEV